MHFSFPDRKFWTHRNIFWTRPLVSGATAIVRGVVQVEETTSEIHDTVKITEYFDMEYCRGNLCNANDAGTPGPGEECFFCKASANDTDRQGWISCDQIRMIFLWFCGFPPYFGIWPQKKLQANFERFWLKIWLWRWFPAFSTSFVRL